MQTDHSLRQEMLAAMVLFRSANGETTLFRFANADEEETLKRLAKRLKKEGTTADTVLSKISGVERFGNRIALEEVHPGWIVEHLREESPRLLSLLPNLLSPATASFVLNQLQFEKRRDLSESPGEVSPDLLGVVRSLVEEKIGGGNPLKREGAFDFYHLSCLKGADLQTLLRDLGIEAVARAFCGADSQVLRAILTRFSLAHAKEIRGRIASLKETDFEQRKMAQKMILSISFEPMSPERLLREIGAKLFVRAVGLSRIAWAESLCRKLPVIDGYRLKRALREKEIGREPESPALQETILKRLYVLGTVGKINRYWKEEQEIEPTVMLPVGEGAALHV